MVDCGCTRWTARSSDRHESVIRLQRCSEVIREDLGPDTMLYHPGREAIPHVLDQPSAILWDCLEKARTTSPEQVLRDAGCQAEADVSADVTRIVDELREAGLIAEV